jgi:hypothetical protein
MDPKYQIACLGDFIFFAVKLMAKTFTKHQSKFSVHLAILLWSHSPFSHLSISTDVPDVNSSDRERIENSYYDMHDVHTSSKSVTRRILLSVTQTHPTNGADPRRQGAQMKRSWATNYIVSLVLTMTKKKMTWCLGFCLYANFEEKTHLLCQ